MKTIDNRNSEAVAARVVQAGTPVILKNGVPAIRSQSFSLGRGDEDQYLFTQLTNGTIVKVDGGEEVIPLYDAKFYYDTVQQL